MNRLRRDRITSERKDREENTPDKQAKPGKFKSLLVPALAGLMTLTIAGCAKDQTIENYIPFPKKDLDAATADGDVDTDADTDSDTDNDTGTGTDNSTGSETGTSADTNSDTKTDDTEGISDIDAGMDSGIEEDGGADADSDSETGTNSDTGTETDTSTETDSDTTSDTGTGMDTSTETDSETETDTGSGDSDTDTDIDGDVDGDTDTDTDSDVDTDSDTDTEPATCGDVTEETWDGVINTETSQTVGGYVFVYVGDDPDTGGPVFDIYCEGGGEPVALGEVFEEHGEDSLYVEGDGVRIRVTCGAASAWSANVTITVEYTDIPDAGPGPSDAGLIDAGTDGGSEEPTCVVESPLCEGAVEGEWDGIVNLEAPAEAGGYRFEYLGDNEDGNPVFDIRCAETNADIALGAVFQENGIAYLDVVEDCKSISIDCNAASVWAANVIITVTNL